VPIACHATYLDDGNLRLRGLVGRPDGSLVLRAEAVAAPAEAEQLGVAVAEDLLGQGAAAILADVYGD
jgi:hydroxymethylbilane synthase